MRPEPPACAARPARPSSAKATGARAIPTSRPNAALLALLLAACSADDCPPPPESAERAELRKWLGALVHVSQCQGLTPTVFQAARDEQSRREAAFLERVERSPVAEDLARAKHEEDVISRHTFEAECDLTYYDRPNAPPYVARYRASLDYDRENLRTAEAAFAAAMAGCTAG